ncbi:hypothetical protein MMC08_003826 [Hypocenomyce scalaris]|nr:hypothetical protein [Hypocenomyce scalaris]
MSSDSLAAFRKSGRDELSKLTEEHMKHDLQQSDRDALRSAATKLSTYATVGSVLGLGLGLFMAYRVRRNRTSMFNAFRAKEKPTHVQFAGGRIEPIPDITPMLRPTTLGDIATYFFFSAGGLFLGGETGLLTGSYSANRTVSRDPESRARIETAFRKLRADVLRTEADALDGGESVMDKLF